jgi:hypothetical protein
MYFPLISSNVALADKNDICVKDDEITAPRANLFARIGTSI